MLAFLLSPAGRALGVTALVAAMLLAAYAKGYDVCRDEYARRSAQEAAAWAKKVRVSEAQAYARGLQAAKSEARNLEIVDEIGEQAAAEPDSGAECLSADTVERLRTLE